MSTNVRLMRLPEVMQATGFKRALLYRAMKAGEFPRPRPLRDGGRAVGWRSDEVDAWIASRQITASAAA